MKFAYGSPAVAMSGSEASSRPPQPFDYFVRLQALTHLLDSAISIKAVADAVLGEVCLITGADRGVLVTLEADDAVGPTQQHDLNLPPGDEVRLRTDADSTPLAASMSGQRTITFADRDEFRAAFPNCSCRGEPVEGAVAAIPLLLGNDVLGAMGLFYADPHSFSPWEVSFLETAAALCVRAIRQVRQAAWQPFLRHRPPPVVAGKWYGSDGAATGDGQRREPAAHISHEDLLADAKSAAGLGSWEVDIISGQVLWSAEMFRLMEFDPAQGIPSYEQLLARFHPDDVPLHRAMEQRARQGGEPRDFDIRVRYSDGRQGWLHAIGRSEKDAAGKVIRTLGILMDITERKRAEQALRESEDMLHAIIEQMPAGIIGAEAPSGRILFCNQEMERILGKPVIRYANLADYTDPALCNLDGTPMVPEHYPLVRAIRRHESLHQHEVLIKRADGTQRICAINAAPIRNKAGEVIAGVVALNDVDDQKRLQQQFLQAQKMEGIGRLAGGIAHDFNNLLSVVLGYADLIGDELPPESALRPGLRHMADAAESASKLTRELLSFARRQPTEPQIIAPNEQIECMMKILRPLIGADISLGTQLDARVRNVKIDPHQLEQVLVNLVINACDAMPDGGALTIRTAEKRVTAAQRDPQFAAPAGEYARLSVVDTGTGMTEDVRARIFEPFFSTKDPGRGTGLGLASVYGIIEQHGGSIVVESAPGQGSAFHIYLPIVEDTASSAPQTTESVSASPGSETILVVEDEPLLRDLAVRTLRRSGYQVLDADNGLTALQIAAAYGGEIHLLLTDAIMPKMGGLELAERLCATRPGIPVLLASGYAENRFTGAQAIPPGIGFLRKPFTPKQLLARIKEVLG